MEESLEELKTPPAKNTEEYYEMQQRQLNTKLIHEVVLS